ncbi:MAG: integrase catalytic region [Burkholderia sp.]|nr:integrase catalytic region [Burkholderia sp.]
MKHEDIKAPLSRHRFPGAVISCGALVFSIPVQLKGYRRATLRAPCGGSYETIRRWCDKFGAHFTHRVKQAKL